MHFLVVLVRAPTCAYCGSPALQFPFHSDMVFIVTSEQPTILSNTEDFPCSENLAMLDGHKFTQTCCQAAMQLCMAR
jgi:hypothetical protein